MRVWENPIRQVRAAHVQNDGLILVERDRQIRIVLMRHR